MEKKWNEIRLKKSVRLIEREKRCFSCLRGGCMPMDPPPMPKFEHLPTQRTKEMKSKFQEPFFTILSC